MKRPKKFSPLALISIPACVELAKAWAAEEGKRGGYVVVYAGKVAGWSLTLGHAHGWVAGCVAVEIPTLKAYRATGGDRLNGCDQWELNR